ncbi:PilN domain-containing protein [Massilia horti]|uniref:Uncharacterized protein n=1 Tax=Massilia horti TaxID=2562153 RepID=A0A4Y9T589_9BURK|nr:PilN domain-containing protein [Massilia horti]TFW32307.1 hypothetical protein E4O92_10075 [Massilia horti]
MPPLVLSHMAAPANHRRQLFAVAMLAAVIFGLGTLRLADLRAQAALLRADTARFPAHRIKPAASAGQTQAVPAVRWERLFQALASAASADVSLLAFDPAPQQRRVRLDGEARDLPALLDYLRRLGTAGTFVRVLLQSHQTLRDDPQHPVRFTVLAEWGDST